MVEVSESPFRQESVSSQLSEYNGIEEQLQEMQISLEKRTQERDIRNNYFNIRLQEIRNRADKLQKNRIDRLNKDGIFIDLNLIRSESKVNTQTTERKLVMANVVNIEADTTKMNNVPEDNLKNKPETENGTLQHMTGDQLVSSVKDELAKLKLNVPFKSQKTSKGKTEKTLASSIKKGQENVTSQKKSIVLPVAGQTKQKNLIRESEFARRGSAGRIPAYEEKNKFTVPGMERRRSSFSGDHLGISASSEQRKSLTPDTSKSGLVNKKSEKVNKTNKDVKKKKH